MPKISPFLWFDKEAEQAANFYVSVFPNSKVGEIQRYPEAAPGQAGTVMTVAFELNGEPFTALNGGPLFQFNESVSFVIDCADQAEVDHFWDKLTADGGKPVQCGWLKDKYGLSWQVVPKAIYETTAGPDAAGPAGLRRDDADGQAGRRQAEGGLRGLTALQVGQALP